MLYVGLTNFLFLLRYALAGRGRARRQIYVVVLFSLFLFSAFRWEVGCDWSGYQYQFQIAQFMSAQTPFLSSNDGLWWWLIARLNISGLAYPWVNVVSSLIFFIGVHVLARRQPDPLAFLILLFPILIINMPMSGIRQGAAIGLICIAFTAFIDRRPLKYSIWLLLAGGFHTSALVFMLLLPLSVGRYSRGRFMLTAILALPGAYILYSSEAAEVASSRYINTGIDAVGAVFRVGILGLSALYFFMFVRRKWMREFPGDYILASIGAIGMALAFFLVPISTVIADRFGYYLIPIQAMIFARLPFLPFRRNAALHSAAPYLGLLLVFAVWSQLSYHFQQCYIPYQTWIFGFPGGDPVGF
jgi:hypothetical protein